MRAAEKLARLRQIKENKIKRRHEEKQEKALDQFLMMKVREELEAEQKYLEFKKEHQRQVMDQLRKENDERLALLKKEEYDERQENIKLMNAYAKLIDDQDAERERTMKERDQKMKDFQLKASVTTLADNHLKLMSLENRREKYEQRHEKKLQEIEQEKKQQEAQQKKELKSYLFAQIEQKDERKKLEKKEYDQQIEKPKIIFFIFLIFDPLKQAEIWKEDADRYHEFENEKKRQKQDIMNTYSNQLRTQLQMNEDKKRTQKTKMNENEALLNKHLLSELDSLREEIAQNS